VNGLTEKRKKEGAGERFEKTPPWGLVLGGEGERSGRWVRSCAGEGIMNPDCEILEEDP